MGGWGRRIVIVGCASVLGIPVLVGHAAAIPPTSPDCKPPQNHRMISDIPWPLRWYAPQRIWPVSTGAGVTVAVIDSGVDGRHPQMQGKVATGRDFLDRQATGAFDCVGHGTAVASIIAATPRDGVGFVGLAPGVTVLPIRVSERSQVDDGAGTEAAIDSGQLAEAINYAVDQGAKVINLSIYQFVNDPRIQAAVANAVRRDVVLVAAVGNGHNQANGDKDAVPYPAAYDGVIGVGAIDENGVRVGDSAVGPFVDLVAAGAAVTAAASRSGDYWTVDGTSFAAPHVAAAAALVRSRWPSMSAKDVARRLQATADPVRAGPRSDEYGFGAVDPYRAVNETDVAGPPSTPSPVARPRAEVNGTGANWLLAVGLTAGFLGLSALILLGVWVFGLGRGRRWTPGVSTTWFTPETAETAAHEWSLGTRPPVWPHPDRKITEQMVQRARQRRRNQRR